MKVNLCAGGLPVPTTTKGPGLKAGPRDFKHGEQEVSVAGPSGLDANRRSRPLALAHSPSQGQHQDQHDCPARDAQVLILDHNRRDDHGNDIDHLDHRVEGRAGGVLHRVTDGVAHDTRHVPFRTLPGVLGRIAGFVLDEFLGIVPGAAGVVHEDGQQLS